MPRLYCPEALAVGATLALPDTLVHHLRVLRLQPGAALTLFNGDGQEYSATLCAIDKRSADARIDSATAHSVELPYAVTLAQALPEAAKMDWIIEKAVELGVAAVQPLSAQRCVVRLAGERADKRMAHWQAVIVAAAEQSGRSRLAQLAPLEEVGKWLARPLPQPRILLSPRGGQSLAAWARTQAPQALTLMVGPEGGFSAAEEDAALAHGALALSIGPRILRTETAALAALAMLAAVWDQA